VKETGGGKQGRGDINWQKKLPKHFVIQKTKGSGKGQRERGGRNGIGFNNAEVRFVFKKEGDGTSTAAVN